jgi:hypothetical protein
LQHWRMIGRSGLRRVACKHEGSSSFITECCSFQGPLTLTTNHHAGTADISGLDAVSIRPRFDLVNQQTLHINHQFAGEAYSGGYAELADDQPMLKDALFIFDTLPDTFVFIISIPPGANGSAISFAQIQDFMVLGVLDCV